MFRLQFSEYTVAHLKLAGKPFHAMNLEMVEICLFRKNLFLHIFTARQNNDLIQAVLRDKGSNFETMEIGILSHVCSFAKNFEILRFPSLKIALSHPQIYNTKILQSLQHTNSNILLFESASYKV